MGKKPGLFGIAVLGLPIIEVIALVAVGSALGFLSTIALFLLLSLTGAWLFRVRLAGLAATSLSAQGSSGAAKVTGRSIGSSVLAVLGAGLIMLPGFVTAVAGLLLQFGPLRSALAHRVTDNFSTMVGGVGTRYGAESPFDPSGSQSASRGDVIDTDLAPNSNRPSSQSQEPFPELS